MQKYGIVLATLLILTACTSTSVNKIPESMRSDKEYGEALYFQSRCPQYKSINLAAAMVGYCLASKLYNQRCDAQQLAQSFDVNSRAAYKLAETRYKHQSAAKVCAVAERRYGANGSEFKKLLLR